MAYEYLFAALPPLPARPGGDVPLEPRALAEAFALEGGAAGVLGRELLMRFDIQALERIAMGGEPGETALFSPEAIADRQGLPHWLAEALAAVEREEGEGFAFDAIWAAAYRHALERASAVGCAFLQRWIPWEGGLRAALALHRARAMEIAPERAVPDGLPALPDREYKTAVEGLTSIEEREGDWRERDRFVAGRMLDLARDWAPPYSFDLDELMGYVVQFIILKQHAYLKE